MTSTSESRTALQCLVLPLPHISCSSISVAVRPQYGGSLFVQLHAALVLLTFLLACLHCGRLGCCWWYICWCKHCSALQVLLPFHAGNAGHV